MLRLISADYFARSPLLALPVVALFLFVLVFTLVTLRALFSRHEDVARMAELPFDDAEEKEHG